MNKVFLATRNFLRDEEGVTAIEYALIAALIAVAMIVGATVLGRELDTRFRDLCTKLGGTNCNATS